MLTKTILLPLISGLTSAALIALMLRLKQAMPMDHPNDRSLHERPVPRTGGVGIMLGIGLGWAILWPPVLMPILGLALALAALSLLDDAFGLSRLLRFGLHLAAAALLVAISPSLPGGVWSSAAAILAVAWMTNVFNFMDGANGLAGGMALFGFGCYSLAAWLGNDPALCIASLCVAAAAAGFLLFNFDPARIFMGDAGSVPLGFLAAALGLAGWQQGVWTLAFPVLAFSPFIADASATMARRILHREKFWQPHRDHYYQWLVRMGLGHRRVALAEYAVMAAACGSAMAVRSAPVSMQLAILLAWCVLYAMALLAVGRAWDKHGARPC